MTEKNDYVIEIDHVTMNFNLAKERADTVKEYVVRLLKGELHFNSFTAVSDVSYRIKRGESLALIGRNGSGKSTLLKIVAGVLYPSKGSVTVHGTIAPLIELGAGFDGDLTARENIFLNGAVLGFSREFMQSHFDEIIEFAELRDFVDVPVKNYSSGMVARLGFAIATIVGADILVVDEILAVGDYKFQEKCKKRMAELMANGTTLLFVSHSEEQVKELCQNAIWLDGGKARAIGPVEEVFRAYRSCYG